MSTRKISTISTARKSLRNKARSTTKYFKTSGVSRYNGRHAYGDLPRNDDCAQCKTIDGYVAEEPGAIADCAANENLTYVHLLNNDTGFDASAEDTQIAIGMRYGFEHKDAINNILLNLSSEDRLAIMQEAVEFSTDNTSVQSTFFSRIGNIIKHIICQY